MTSAAQLVNQQYTVNSCTLEITAATSALSQWSQQPILKQVRFRLWLTDPEAPQPDLIAQGDQVQLSNLSESIQHYIQTHLTHADLATPTLPTFSTGLTWPLAQHQLPIVGQPEPLTLTTLGLFDVAEVLDQYEQNSQLQPALPKAVDQQRRRPISLWTGSAVAAMILTVGVTATLRQFYQQELATQADRMPEATLEQAAPESDTVTPDANGQPPATSSLETPASKIPPENEQGTTPGTQPEGTTSTASPPAASPPATPPPSNSRPLPSAATPRPSEQPGRNQPIPSPTASSSNPQATRPSNSAGSTASSPPSLRDEAQPDSDVTSSTEPTEPNLESGNTALSTEPNLRQGPAIPRSPASPPPNVPESAPEQDTALENQPFSSSPGLLTAPNPRPSAFASTIDEVSAYFRTRWQGSNRNEPLVYELLLNPNGTVAAWHPLNAAATRQRWTFPTEALVAPFEQDSRLTLSVILYPNGQVQVSEVQVPE